MDYLEVAGHVRARLTLVLCYLDYIRRALNSFLTH